MHGREKPRLRGRGWQPGLRRSRPLEQGLQALGLGYMTHICISKVAGTWGAVFAVAVQCQAPGVGASASAVAL